jgi:Rhodopirellula transposase DDE domain
VSRASGVSRRAIRAGLLELKQKPEEARRRTVPIRREGGGRKKTLAKDPALWRDLEKLVEPTTRGDPESPLRWTCKSVRRLGEELRGMGHPVSHTLVAELLRGQNYSLQANRKTTEGSSHPDRNAQFEHINTKVEEFLKRGQPAISVDTKKKEQVGDYKNGGREWRPQGQPERVRVHDFAQQKDVPYGVYDLGQDAGWVSVGTDHDTAAFAVESIRRWWSMMGRASYPRARQLLITADSGGSNGARLRLWKMELQQLADETGLEISVCHFPPGTSKWNKIEHRLFSFITQNWRGQPLVSHEVIVNLIAATTTRTGLHVRSQLDTGKYPKGIKVSKAEYTAIRLYPDVFHGDWNYSITPHR